jgi:hypothetical protein
MLTFSQSEIEGQLSDCFPYGTIKKVHVITGIGQSYLEQFVNPNDERKSPAYQNLQIGCALDEIDAGLGDRYWQHIALFREVSKPILNGGRCIDTAALSNHKESFDVADAAMRGKPLYVQLKEVLEQEAAIAKHKAAILEAINNEKASPNGSNSRYAGVSQ